MFFTRRLDHKKQFFEVIRTKNLQQVQDFFCSLTGKQIGTDAVDVNLSTALIMSAEDGSKAICSYLLDERADANLQNVNGKSPLIQAAFNGHLDVCRCLVEAKANIDLADNDGCTALMHASSFGWNKICRLLIECRANVNLLQNENKSALMLAAQSGFLHTCCFLVNASANLDAQDREGYTALIHASCKGFSEICRFLLRNKADHTLQTNDSWDAKSSANAWKHLMCMKLFQSFEQQERNGSDFRDAAKNGSIEQVLNFVADERELIDIPDNSLTTALIWAAKNGHIQVCKCLITNKASIDSEDLSGRTALFEAASFGHVQVCADLIEGNSNINLRDLDDNSALIQAAKNGHTEVCKFLLLKGAEKDAQNQMGYTALLHAASSGNLDIWSILVEAGASVKLQTLEGNSAFMLAAQNGHEKICQYLIEKGEDINQVNLSDQSLLIMAAENGHGKICHDLINAKANINKKNKSGQSALTQAAENGHSDVCKQLINSGRGVCVDVLLRSGRSALCQAASKGNFKVCTALIDGCAQINTQDDEGHSALILAADNGHNNICALLLQNRADVDLQLKISCQTALCRAASNGYTDVCCTLIEESANVDKHDADGNSALMLAAHKGFSEVCSLLIEKKAKIDRQNNEGQTALIQAAAAGNLEVCKILMYADAKDDLCDVFGNSAIIAAAEKGQSEVCNFLVGIGASVNIKNKVGQCALMQAACNNYINICRDLIEARADLDHQDVYGTTALIGAASRGHNEVCSVLVHEGANPLLKQIEGWSAVDAATLNGKPKELIQLLQDFELKNTYFDAARFGKLDKVKQLLVRHPDLLNAQEQRRNNWSCSPPLVNLFSSLHYAAKENYTEMVDYLLNQEDIQVSLSTRDFYKRTPLLWAAREGREEITQLVCSKSPNLINHHDFEGRTSLILAARENHPSVVLFLLKQNASCNSKGLDGRTALHWSATMGHSNITQMLCDAEVNLNLQDSEGMTPLILAAKNNRREDVNILINSNASLSMLGMERQIKNSEIKSLLDCAAECDTWLNCGCPDFTLLDEKFCNVIGRAVHRALEAQMYYFFCKHENALKGLLKTLEMQLQNMQSFDFDSVIRCLGVEAAATTKKTVLMLAAEENFICVIRKLLELKVEIDKKFLNKWTSLMISSHFGHVEAVQLLLHHNADINHQSNTGDTALMLAARQKHYAVVYILLENNADLKHENTDGCTALIEASRSGSLKIMEIMLKYYLRENMDVDLCDKNRWTSLMHGTWEGHIEVVKLLVENQANLNFQNDMQNTPLALAAIKGHSTLVDFLIQKGADTKLMNIKKQTVKMQVEDLVTKARQLQLHGYGIGDEVDFVPDTSKTQDTCTGQILAVRQAYNIACEKDTFEEQKVFSTQVPFKPKATAGWETILEKLEKHIPTQEDFPGEKPNNVPILANDLSSLSEMLKGAINKEAAPQISLHILQKIFDTSEILRSCLGTQLKSALAQNDEKKSAVKQKDKGNVSDIEEQVSGKQSRDDFLNAHYENFELATERLSGPELTRFAKLSIAEMFDSLGISRYVLKTLFIDLGLISLREIEHLNVKDWLVLEQKLTSPDFKKLKEVFEMPLKKEANEKALQVHFFTQCSGKYNCNLQNLFMAANISRNTQLLSGKECDMQDCLENTLSGPELARLMRCTLHSLLDYLDIPKSKARYCKEQIGMVSPTEFHVLTPKEWNMLKERMSDSELQKLNTVFGLQSQLARELSFPVKVGDLCQIQTLLSPTNTAGQEIGSPTDIESFSDSTKVVDKDDRENTRKNISSQTPPKLERCCSSFPSPLKLSLLTISARSISDSYNLKSSLDTKDSDIVSMLSPQFDLHVVPREFLLALTRLIPFEEAGVRCNAAQVDSEQHRKVDGIVFCLKTLSENSKMRKWVSMHDKKLIVFRQQLVFLSHRWLSESHPDDKKNTKLEHIQQLAIANPGWKYYWIDFMCVPQTKTRYEEQVKAIDSLPHFVKCCSTLITLCGDKGESKLDVYRRRGWCRLEQLSAVIPLFCKGHFGERFLCSTKHYISNKCSLSFTEMPRNCDYLLNPLKGDFCNPRDQFRIARALEWMSERLLDIPRLHGLAAQILNSIQELWTVDLSAYPFEASIVAMHTDKKEEIYTVEVMIPQVISFSTTKKYSDFQILHKALKSKHDKVKQFVFPQQNLRWVFGFASEEDKKTQQKMLDTFCKLLGTLQPISAETSEFFFPTMMREELGSPKYNTQTLRSPTFNVPRKRAPRMSQYGEKEVHVQK